MDRKPLIIGIAGRSCSGKSTLARELHEALDKNISIHIDIDKFLVNSADFNCEKPGELEHEAIKELKVGLSQLKEGKQAEFPIYYFDRKSKLDKPPKQCSSEQTILVDGTLIFWDEDIRDLIDVKIFIDVPDAICLERRLKRYLPPKQKGIEEYNNKKARILSRWKIVSKQWDKHLEPTKEYADITIPYHSNVANAVDIVLTYLFGEVN